MSLIANLKLTPTSTKTVTQGNYVSFYDFSSHVLPDTHNEIARIYGNQSVAGMLHLLGSESSMASDKTIWTEEGRLHTVYKDVTRSNNTFTKASHVFRVNETVHISDGAKRVQGIITAADTNTFTVAPYKTGAFTGLGTTALTVFVYGSEFRKGTGGMKGSLDSSYTVLENKPVILKDMFEVSGSDAATVGWIKTEEGWLWYLVSEKDTRLRWEDRMELAMIAGQKADTGSDAETAGYGGTEGLFESIKGRGQRFEGLLNTIADIDTLIKAFDANGKLTDYMHYCDRDQSLAIDDMLGELNAGYEGGLSYGIFNNNKDMCVNLGFSGYKRGGYNVFKSDWKLLNDPTLYGSIAKEAGKVSGVMIPVGSKEVYEGAYNGNGLGNKITTPYLEQKYRSAGNENRKYKTWVLGTVGNVKTNDNDNMEVHHLSERLLKTVGANNFVIFEG